MISLRKAPLWFPLLASIPFIQLGISFYVSVQLIAFLYLAIKSPWPKIPSKYLSALLLASSLIALKSLITALEGASQREIALPIRESICFFMLIIGILKLQKENINTENLNKAAIFLLITMASLSTIQRYNISQGIYFGFPVEWFIKNSATLEGAELALSLQSRFRPPVFFGEPSYAAFVMLSLLVIVFETSKNQTQKLISLGASLIICTNLSSLAAFISLFIFIAFSKYSKNSSVTQGRLHMLTLAVTAPALIGAIIFDQEISHRIVSIVNGADISSSIRFRDPFLLLSSTISSGSVFGISEQDMVNLVGYSSLDNALMRILIYYGALALPAIFLIFNTAKSKPLSVYILLAMNFNGDILSYDKVVILALVIGVCLGSRSQLRA